MSKRKESAPTVSYRKLRRTTLITKNNLGKVMGDINRFLRKPVFRFSGFQRRKTGEEVIECNGETFVYSIETKEKYPYYRPFIAGTCDVHPMWKKYHEDPSILYYKDEDDIPRLAINSPFESSCCPIKIGSRYSILGNRLIILDKFNQYLHNSKYHQALGLRFHEFIQVPESEIDWAAIRTLKADAFLGSIGGDIAYAPEELEFRVNDEYFRRHLYDVIRDFENMIAEDIDKIFEDDTRESVVLRYDLPDEGKIVNFKVNPKLWMEKGYTGLDLTPPVYCFHAPHGDWSTPNLVQAVFCAYQEDITESNEATIKEEDYEFSWD